MKNREIINLSEFYDIWDIIYGDYEDENSSVIFKHITCDIEECDDHGNVKYSVVFQRVSDDKFFKFNYTYIPDDSNWFPDIATEVFPKEVMTTIYE